MGLKLFWAYIDLTQYQFEAWVECLHRSPAVTFNWKILLLGEARLRPPCGGATAGEGGAAGTSAFDAVRNDWLKLD